jgi:hypothetical protein
VETGSAAVLIAFSLAAVLMAGLAKAPWWFWLIGAASLFLLLTTDPARLRPSYAEARGLNSVLLVLDDLKKVSMAGVMAAAAFAAGSALSLALPI